jgi:hypothetical protein
MDFTADQILRMTARDAETQLLGNQKDIKRGFKRALSQWHPDVCADPKADDVFSHIISLRDRLLDKRSSPASQGRILKTAGGRSLSVSPLVSHMVDQGEILVNRETIATLFPSGLSDIAEREVSAPNSFKFADAKMERQMMPFLPKVIRVEDMEGGGKLVISRKGKEEILLADLIARRGAMPDVHAAWLCSGLLNIAAWMEYAGLVHGDISPHSVLIDPALHSVRLVNGWGFSTKSGSRPAALPGRTLDIQPRMAIKGVIADSALDLELIRQTVREALGDPRGTSGTVKSLPGSLSSWVNMPARASAYGDYEAWQRALVAGWGVRKFADYSVRSKDIYQ